ncbi:hypothetical protein V8E53_015484 [Lactarius tabidus]
MHDRRRTRLVSPHQSVTLPEECLRRVTIGMLSGDVLLSIFRYCLDASPWCWPRLVHVCRKWRHIVFGSQHTLHLRLLCTHGTPVLEMLDCWPTLPIVIQYGGPPALDPPSPEDEDNILDALKHSDRVHSIYLTVTKPLLTKLSSIETSFSELEDLVLLYPDYTEITLPSAFRWGTRLRTLHLTAVSLPTLLQHLSSSRNLVDIQLHNIANTAYHSPEALANALSWVTQLRSLSLHLRSSASHPENIGILPSSSNGKRVAFPTLSHLNFQGTCTFFDRFVVGIDSPRLGNIEITFNQPTFFVSKLCEFIERIEMQMTHHRADILFSDLSVSISFIKPGPTCLKLQVCCESFSLRLYSMAQICSGLSALLLGVEHLGISGMRPSSRKDDSDCEGWLKLIHPFRGTKWFHVAGDHSSNIVLALRHSEMRGDTVLPALHKLCIREPEPRCVTLREAVVSFMHSRRLSGHIFGVEYERPWINECLVTGTFSRHVTIEMLPDDALLHIFHHSLCTSQKFWPTLTHVCQRWRKIVFTSPLGLNLRLYCTYGTPVLKTLDCWPALPLIVNYGGSPALDPPAPEDEENIVAALLRSDRVVSISITVTDSLLEDLSAISEPFSELEELVLLSRDNLQLTLPSTFRWGHRLLTLQSTRIGFPSLPQILSLCQDLVYLQLHEIPSTGYFSPEAFANALSGKTQLETFSLHFLSLPPRRTFLRLPPISSERIVLPALTCLKYRGTSKYLDNLVARIDAPRLGDIDITFFSQPTVDASQLGRFIERIEVQTSLSQADVETSAHAISICFSQPGAPTKVKLQISCEQLDWQLSSIAQICDQFSPFLFRMNDLGISSTQSPSGKDNMDDERWIELIRLFGSATDFRVAGVHVANILCALRSVDRGHMAGTVVLPAMLSLHVQEPMPIVGPLWEAAQSFITSRRLWGCPIELYVPHFSCHLCNTSFTQRQTLRRHLEDKHMFQKVCPLCGVFKWSQGRSYLFRAHLASKHPEFAHTDPFTSNPSLDTFPIFSSQSQEK